MAEGRPTLQVIDGDRSSTVETERIAMSFVVHERRRLDVPLSAVVRLEACATETFFIEGRHVTYTLPHVAVWLAPHLQKRLHGSRAISSTRW